jgi:hypothetical protein
VVYCNRIKIGNFKNRPFKIGVLTKVHKNLHNGLWVITQKIEGKWMVCHYSNDVVLEGDIQFKISEKSRLRAVEQKTRNVHAYVQGILVEVDAVKRTEFPNHFSYNPFKYDCFYNTSNFERIDSAKAIIFNGLKSTFLK